MGALPADFVFGVSTASYQIEGAVTADGRGRSVWDDFCDRPGAIVDGSSGAVACDSYHRYAEDVALIRGLGADAYRFSIAWPRVIPDGTGAVNPAGLDYYDRLVDALCDAGVKPCATLFHWDLPSPLEAVGGWVERDTAQAFAAYAQVVAERLADRVAMWCPVNEPVIVTQLGYGNGMHAPGKTLGLGALPVAHHLLLGHGLAVAALRAAGAAAVGAANNHTPVWPLSQEPADLVGAQFYDALHNRLFADPMLLGSYPDGFAALVPGPVADDLEIISAPLDFYGFNYYFPTLAGAPGGAGDPAIDTSGLPFTIHRIEGYPRTDFDWPVVPDGLRELLVQLQQRYAEHLPPMYVTENGCADAVEPDASGRAADPERIAYLDGHLAAVAQAREEGARIDGYFCWSLMDNFEWAEGYTKRFGLVHIDLETGTRTPRDSYAWYRDYIAATRASAPQGV
ncbi:MAG: GH1 family beta-glucosidase [Tetrasphaera sp.]